MPIPVEDQLAIHEVVARADDAASSRDAATYLALFTDDAILDGDKGAHQGKAALASIVGPVWSSEGAATRHLTLNVVLNVLEESAPVVLATSTLVIVSLGTAPRLQSVSSIAQQLVKVDGAWKIRRRSVVILS